MRGTKHLSWLALIASMSTSASEPAPGSVYTSVDQIMHVLDARSDLVDAHKKRGNFVGVRDLLEEPIAQLMQLEHSFSDYTPEQRLKLSNYLVDLGLVTFRLNDYALSQVYHQGSVDLFPTPKNHAALAIVGLTRSNHLARLGNFVLAHRYADQAAQVFTKAIDLSEKLGDEDTRSYSTQHLTVAIDRLSSLEERLYKRL